MVAGRDAAADVHPERAELDAGGHARIRWFGREVTLGVVGLHQVDNAMLALAAAQAAGADPARAVERCCAHGGLPPGRANVSSRRARLTVIDDTYNANPGSLRAALQFAHWLAARHGRPLAIVVGSMLELGAESARLHAAAAAEIVALAPALIAAVGEFVPAFRRVRPSLGDRLGDRARRGEPRARPRAAPSRGRNRAAEGVPGRQARTGAATPQLRGTWRASCSITSSRRSPKKHLVFNLLNYITFRAAAATVTALFVAFVFGPPIIAALRRHKIGQVVRAEGPATHQAKRGTPTMGGLIILLATIVPTLLWARLDSRYVVVALVATLWMGGIGVLDDFLKIVRGKSQGLVARWKLAGQVSLGLALGALPPRCGRWQPTSGPPPPKSRCSNTICSRFGRRSTSCS